MKRTWIPLTPYVPVETTKGWGYAWYILDSGQENDVHWFVVLNEGAHTGQFWIFSNKQVRACKNITMGRARADELKKDPRTQPAPQA